MGRDVGDGARAAGPWPKPEPLPAQVALALLWSLPSYWTHRELRREPEHRLVSLPS